MADEDVAALREAAQHRGYRLVRSRRRKPGGDFGKFGLTALADGAEVLGFGKDGLTASADEVAAFLRKGTQSDWAESAKGLPKPKRKPAPKAKPAPKPAPKPKLKKLAPENLLARLPSAKPAEVFTELLTRPGVKVERIVSHGQTTPEDEPFVQDAEEWVLILAGAARLRIEGFEEVALAPGDHLLIPGGVKHWVTWTTPDEPTVWLALHLG